MVIDINPILKGDTSEIIVDYLLSTEEAIDDITFPVPFSVQGMVKDMAGYITLNLNACVKYATACARCLIPISKEITVCFSKTVVTEQTELQTDETDDYIISRDGLIDVDETLIEQILLELPLKHLCKEDCKGLCPKCGADLNTHPCNCDTSEPDPRFDVLRKLLENKND